MNRTAATRDAIKKLQGYTKQLVRLGFKIWHRQRGEMAIIVFPPPLHKKLRRPRG